MHYCREIQQLNKNMIHVSYWDYERTSRQDSILIDPKWKYIEEPASNYTSLEDEILFTREGTELLRESGVQFIEMPVFRFESGNDASVTRKQTANGDVVYKGIGTQLLDHMAYKASVKFCISPGETLTGLGQMDGGSLNVRGRKEYLFQTNMRIAVPFLISSANYGILIDTESPVIFENKGNIVSFEVEVTEGLSYYVINGKDLDEVIFWFRELTGRVELLPRWAFGYIQSKEKYGSAKELEEIANQFRANGLPLDCVVQDWQSWEGSLWGEKTPDVERYPDLKGLLSKLHDANVKLMWSIWPNMSPDCSNYKEFSKEQLLLANSNVYDAFSEEGRKIYWEQCERSLFSAGMDAWWCDNAEPFSDAEWNGATKRPDADRYNVILQESKRHMPWEKMNSYGLYHAKGIYDGWRSTGSKKRVVNLTRSVYVSSQKYGVIPWSGDIAARWDVMRQQIAEGLRISLSGFPYWTLDIGGFFTVHEKWQNRGCNNHLNPDPLWFWNGDYNDGVNDLGYQELYTRWIQLGTFLPIFRSHGTDTPREPWNFHGENNLFYDAIVKYMNLRYLLLPYIYSTAAAVYREHFTMMRSFLFDFPSDVQAIHVEDSFMFGKYLLIAPVTFPMYYEKDSQKIVNSDKVRRVYLPEGKIWYDFWTNECHMGGTVVEKEAPIEIIPIYVMAGAIIPCSKPMEYADERNGEISKLMVFEGADGEFVIYNDEGDNYSYQNENYCAISLNYDDVRKTLTFGEKEGNFPCQKEWEIVYVRRNGKEVRLTIPYVGKRQVYTL